jgi:hypothetical protein
MMDSKTAARAAFDRAEADLVALSHRIHAHPELKWEEEQACAWLGEALTGYGFLVQTGICQLPTAFEAAPGRVRCMSGSALSTTPFPASGTRAATTSSRPPPWAPAWPWPQWLTSWGLPCG